MPVSIIAAVPDAYQDGDTATLALRVTGPASDPVDPATLTLTVRAPTGAQTTYAYPGAPVVRDATGVYHADIVVTEGRWSYQWATTAPAQVQGGQLQVQPAPVTPRPVTLDALKRRLDLEASTDDDKLQEYLDAALAQAQAPWPHGCGRLLTPDSVPRTVTVRRGRALIPDASAITSVTVDGTAVTDYKTLRKDGYIVQITGLSDTATEAVVAGAFGFTALPANLADAIYVLAARMHYEEAAQYADQVAVLEGTAVQNYYRQLPPRTKLVFQTYAVPAAIAGLA
jgi:hypothetical protein